MGIPELAALGLLIFQTIQKMQQEGRDQTTADEQKALADAVAAMGSEDQRFDGQGK